MFARTQLISHFFVYKQINWTQKSPLIRSFFLDKLCEPQTIAVVRHRWLFIIKKRHSLAVTCLKHEKHTIWIIFPDDNLCMLLNICMFVYGLLWQISQWKWNALNHFKFPFDWRNQNIFGFFVPCFDVKTFGYLWKHYMGTAFFWNQLIMKVISVIRFVSWIFYYLICDRHFSHCEAAQRIKGRKPFRMISSSFLFEFCSHISAGKFESS